MQDSFLKMQCGPHELLFTYRCMGEEREQRVPIVRQMQQKGAETEVLLVVFNNRQYVVKFTSARDVDIHRTLYNHDVTRDDVIRLVHTVPAPPSAAGGDDEGGRRPPEWPADVATVTSIRGSNVLRRRPWKLMPYVDEVEERAMHAENEAAAERLLNGSGKRKRAAALAAAAVVDAAAPTRTVTAYVELVRRVVGVVPELRDETDWKSPKNIMWMRLGGEAPGLLPRVFDFD